MSAGTPPALPARFGRYVLHRKLATGGMAQIYLAEQHSAAGVSKLVVLKRMLPHLGDDDRYQRMFLDEARLASRLSHPNIVQVFDYGEIEGHRFLAMEYLAGETLSDVIRQTGGRPLPVDVALQIVALACEGLHYAHEYAVDGVAMNVVHRDVSPSNVMVTYQGAVKLLDFGIARIVGRASDQTGPGIIKGKLAYCAPEQFRNEAVDRRCDVFGLGVVLFELVTGRYLFRRATQEATVMAVMRDPIPRIEELRPEAPPELDGVLAQALARPTVNRYPTALDMRRDLEALLAERRRTRIDDWMRRLFGEERMAERLDARTRLAAPAPPPDVTSTELQTPASAASEATVVEAGSGSHPTPAPPTRTRRSRLAAAAGRRLVGRDGALRELLEAVGRHRLVTLLGPGGIGKTRLCLAAIEQLREERPARFEAVHVLSLGDEDDLDGMCRRVADELGVTVPGARGHDTLVVSIGGALRARGPTLVVLDELEHLPGAVECIESWLEDAPQLVVLGTSRHALAVGVERAIEVGALSLPERGEDPSSSSAVELFVECVRAFDRDYDPDEDELVAIADVVSRLSGIPLAIEIAAARLRVLTIDGLRDRVLAADGPPGGSAALESEIERSWQLLTPHERVAFAQCSVFRGGFTVDAAEAVLDLGPRAPDIVDALLSLRDKSLLTAGEAKGRLLLLEALRAFAAARLHEAGGREGAMTRLARWLTTRPPEPEERRNARAALAEPAVPPALALALVGALEQMSGGGATPEELALIDAAIARGAGSDALAQVRARAVRARALASTDRPDAAERELAELIPLVAALPAERSLLAELCHGHGQALYQCFRMDEAREALERARDIAREVGDIRREALVLTRLSATFGSTGDRGRALELLERAHEVAERVGDPGLHGSVHAGLGTSMLELGQLDEARRHYGRAVELAEVVRADRRRIVVRGYQAIVELAAGDTEAAHAFVRECVRDAGYVGLRTVRGIFLGVAAAVHARRADLEAAGEALASAFALTEHDPVWRTVVDLYGSHLDIALARRDLVEGAVGRARARLSAVQRRVDAAHVREMPDQAVPQVQISDDVRIGIALLERELGALEEAHAEVGRTDPSPATVPELRVSTGGGFVLDGAPVDLGDRAELDRALSALCEHRVRSPDVAMPTSTLLRAVWPSARAGSRVAAAKLSEVIGELRRRGLQDVVVPEAGGYRLVAAVLRG